MATLVEAADRLLRQRWNIDNFRRLSKVRVSVSLAATLVDAHPMWVSS